MTHRPESQSKKGKENVSFLFQFILLKTIHSQQSQTVTILPENLTKPAQQTESLQLTLVSQTHENTKVVSSFCLTKRPTTGWKNFAGYSGFRTCCNVVCAKTAFNCLCQTFSSTDHTMQLSLVYMQNDIYPRESFREGLCNHRRWFVCLSVCLFVCLFVCYHDN